MITLYTFGPYFGLPDPSPFVMKCEMLLKLSGLNVQENTRGFPGAPKGKLPYIDDDGTIVADSTLIRLYLERKYGFYFDRGLSARDRGVAWASGEDARRPSLLGDGLLALDERRQLRARPGELLQARAGIHPAAGDMDSSREVPANCTPTASAATARRR